MYAAVNSRPQDAVAITSAAVSAAPASLAVAITRGAVRAAPAAGVDIVKAAIAAKPEAEQAILSALLPTAAPGDVLPVGGALLRRPALPPPVPEPGPASRN